MSVSNRQEQILSILDERTYVTVNELATMLFTSPSSIRRDLTYMQNNGLVTRSHGGVSLPTPISGVASYYDRMRKNTQEKRKIAATAAALLEEGQKILLDSSSTATFLLPHIAKVKKASVFTNNLSTALNAIELGIDIHCLGGYARGGSTALSGVETYRALSNINADIMFFSCQALDARGDMSDSTEEENFVRTLMLQATKTAVFLCDSGKFDSTAVYKLGNLNDIHFAVFDRPYDDLKTTCKRL